MITYTLQRWITLSSDFKKNNLDADPSDISGIHYE